MLIDVNNFEKHLRKLNKNYKKVEKYLSSKFVFFDNNYLKCELLYGLSLAIYEQRHFFNENLNISQNLIKFDVDLKKSITIKNCGNIKQTINLDVKRFKYSKPNVHEFSHQLGSIGGICKLDDNNYVATNPSRDSLVVFDERFQIIKVVSNIMYSKKLVFCSNLLAKNYIWIELKSLR